MTADTWRGDIQKPLSLNRWNYVNGNPITFADPSGHCIIVIIGDTLMCVVFIGVVGLVVYFTVIVPTSQYLIEHGAELGQSIDTQCKEAVQFAQDLFNGNLPETEPERKPEIFYDPSRPGTQPTPTATKVKCRGGYQPRQTIDGETICVRRLSDSEVKARGWEEEKQAQGYRATDSIYEDENGNTWIGGSVGVLNPFP